MKIKEKSVLMASQKGRCKEKNSTPILKKQVKRWKARTNWKNNNNWVIGWLKPTVLWGHRRIFWLCYRMAIFPVVGVFSNAMIRGDSFTQPHSGRKFPVNSEISSHTKFIVYLLKCSCGLCYVGKTKREFKTRISKHKKQYQESWWKVLSSETFQCFWTWCVYTLVSGDWGG